MGRPLPIETLPRRELEELQNKRLRYTLTQAYNTTEFWHKKFNSLGLKPEDIRNIEDLKKAYEKGLRVTSRELVEEYDKLVPPYIKNREIDFIELQTSGFGGMPKKIPWPIPPTFSNEVARLGYNSASLSSKSRLFNWLSPYPYSSGILSTLSLDAYFPFTEFVPRWSVETTKPLQIEEAKRIVEDFKPTHIVTLPSKLPDLANKLFEEGKDPKSLGVSTIIVGGEPITKEGVSKIKDVWGTEVEVYDILGSTECSLFGYECEKHDGLHIAENRVILFTADPESNEVLSSSEKGVNVVTNLYTKEDLPGIYIINYLHGDYTSIRSKECDCGRTFLKIDPPIRYDELLNIRGVKLNTLDIEGELFKRPYIKDYLVVEKYIPEKLTNQVEIRILPEQPISETELAEIHKSVLDRLFSSNPNAYKLIKESDITFSVCSSLEELYKGFQIPRGKKRRLFRTKINSEL